MSETLFYLLEDFWTLNGDPRAQIFPFMNSILPTLTIISAYLLFVFFIGPQIMSNRHPLKLPSILLFYNLLMCTTNGITFTIILYNAPAIAQRAFNFIYQAPTEEANTWERTMIFLAYIYLITKFIDLFDTVFFVLRKKQEQVTLLHVYHHASVAFFAWIYFRFDCLCNLVLPFVTMNSFIHTLMYAYYALSTLGPAIRPYLFWKRYITLLQIGQFVVLFGYGLLFLVFQEGYPTFLLVNLVIQASIYFVLFLRFYLITYYGGGEMPKKKNLLDILKGQTIQVGNVGNGKIYPQVNGVSNSVNVVIDK